MRRIEERFYLVADTEDLAGVGVRRHELGVWPDDRAVSVGGPGAAVVLDGAVGPVAHIRFASCFAFVHQGAAAAPGPQITRRRGLPVTFEVAGHRITVQHVEREVEIARDGTPLDDELAALHRASAADPPRADAELAALNLAWRYAGHTPSDAFVDRSRRARDALLALDGLPEAIRAERTWVSGMRSLSTLGCFGESAAPVLPALVRLASSDPPYFDVFDTIAAIVGHAEAPPYVEALVRRLAASPDPDQREAAYRCVWSSSLFDLVIDAARDPANPAWDRAIDRLGQVGLGSPRAIPALEAVAADPSFDLARRRTVEAVVASLRESVEALRPHWTT
ncbi:MAG: HEAT repeat domain-containing protein [Myxococcota bacterium]